MTSPQSVEALEARLDAIETRPSDGNLEDAAYAFRVLARDSIAALKEAQEAVPNAMIPAAQWREKGEPDPHGARYNCERAALVLGDLTDDELANAAYMNYDRALDIDAVLNRKPGYHPPIVWMTAVKDRIRWLSRQLLAASPAPPGGGKVGL